MAAITPPLFFHIYVGSIKPGSNKSPLRRGESSSAKTRTITDANCFLLPGTGPFRESRASDSLTKWLFFTSSQNGDRRIATPPWIVPAISRPFSLALIFVTVTRLDIVRYQFHFHRWHVGYSRLVLERHALPKSLNRVSNFSQVSIRWKFRCSNSPLE